MNVQHHFLAKGETRAVADRQVLAFLDKTLLVRYSEVSIEEETSMTATDPRFWPTVEDLARQHRQTCQHFIDSLQETGITTIGDLAHIEQGYPSKLLHILAHLVDGFFGIDSIFFNLIEDAHTISPALASAIEADPRNYHLVTTSCSFLSTEEASIIHRRLP